MTRRTTQGSDLTAVRAVGAALPADVLARVVDPKGGLPGRSADDYQLELGVTPVEAANRAWSVLTGAWAGYRAALERLPDGDRATSLTRDKWLLVLLRELGFGRVPTTPAGGITVRERSFPVSHESGPVPIHLLGRDVPLDTKTSGLAGAADRAPHAMVQELLNRSDGHLWAIVANDNTLRLLRDSSTLVGQSYVEFDLAAIFDGELFADFTVLYLVCHHSRFQPTDEAGPAGCWLEQWRTDAAETGARALGALRDGVKDAIEALGTGFLRHPTNSDLRDRLAAGDLDLADVHRSLLRLVYRLLFLFVAEDRGLLLDPSADEAAKIRYRDWFSTARLRHVSRHRRGTRHDDQWQALRIVLDGLGHEAGRPELGLPALGGIFENGPVDVTATCSLANEHLLAAVRHLSVIHPAGGGPRRVVDYRNLGAEELGGIYESLLEFVPRHEPHHRTFTLETLAGNDRKTSGAYYTPTSLIDCLLDSALDPLLDQAEQEPDPEKSLLELTVCDPACGSGHFLVAAAKRIAHRVARVRAEGAEPTIEQSQEAIHDVVARCIYGVDLNPMAAELAKVSLWLEAMTAGRPLGFLDAHVKVGNALLGTTPALLAEGIPDDAFVALEGDDKRAASALKKQNKQERAGQGNLFAEASIPVDNKTIADVARQIDGLSGLSLADVHLAHQRQRDFEASAELRQARLLADTWCSAFVAPKQVGQAGITHSTLEAWSRQPPVAGDFNHQSVRRLTAEYRFFHWHLEFPQIFATNLNATGPGWEGGFSCVIGNPPWERIKIQEKEYFQAYDEDIANAPNAAARKKLIASLPERNPTLARRFSAAKRQAECESHFIRRSGRYPLCGQGDINTYPLFAEHGTTIIGADGRFGVITPTGIATDANTQPFFRSLIEGNRLCVLYDFLNNDRLFYGVGNRTFKFCILVVAGEQDDSRVAWFGSFLSGPEVLHDGDRRFSLSAKEISQINPNTGTAPLLRTRRDATILAGIHDRLVILKNEVGESSGWIDSYQTQFHMSGDSELFRTASDLRDIGGDLSNPLSVDAGDRGHFVPLLEGKMFNHFDPRWGDYAARAEGVADSELPRLPDDVLDDPKFVNTPRYWVPSAEVEGRLAGRSAEPWLFAFRDVARSYNERTVICCVLPRVGVGHTAPLIHIANPTVKDALFLASMLSSYVTDWTLRLRQGGTHLTYGYVNQIPVVARHQLDDPCPWDPAVSLRAWVVPRAWELMYTSRVLGGAASAMHDQEPPFRWNPERRDVIRAELDAAFFVLYGLEDDDVSHVMENFHVVRRKDEEAHGSYRTRDRVRELVASMRSGGFVSELENPPGSGPRHEGVGF